MDSRLGFPEVLAVQIQHVRFGIECAPNGCGGAPPDIQTITTRPMFGNREILDDDPAVWHWIDHAMLTGDRAPSHCECHYGVVMLTIRRFKTGQAGRQPFGLVCHEWFRCEV